MDRRQNILRRAAEIFAQQGVARTSIEDIAEAVGIKREGIYYYFRNRGDILLEIILPQSNQLLRGLQRLLRSDMPAIEKLQAAIEMHLEAYNPSYIEMSVALREDHLVENDCKLKELKRVWDDYGDLWVRLVEEGQKTGEFKGELNPKMAAYGLIGMCNWVCRWYKPHRGVAISELIDTFFSIASTGLAAKSSACAASLAETAEASS